MWNWLFRVRRKTDEFKLVATDGTEIVGRLTKYGTLLLQVTDPAGRTVDVQLPPHIVPPFSHWIGNIEGAYSHVDPAKLRAVASVVPILDASPRTDRTTRGPRS